jgi:hypothetical protein
LELGESQRQPRLFFIFKIKKSESCEEECAAAKCEKDKKRVMKAARGRPFYCCCCEWIFWLNENFIKRERRRAGGASVKLQRARQTHARAPDQKPFFYFLRMPRRLIAGAHLSQPFSNYRKTYRARNKRENGTIDASARGRCRRKGLSAAIRRIAPAAGGVMQKAAHRCNAACIKQLLCGFCSRL